MKNIASHVSVVQKDGEELIELKFGDGFCVYMDAEEAQGLIGCLQAAVDEVRYE